MRESNKEFDKWILGRRDRCKMLEYTGHPFVDIGVATIVSLADKKRPEELALEDLDAVADYLEECYTQQPMTSFLTVVFPNSGFTQPAYNRAPEKRLQYARKVLRTYQPDQPRSRTERCIFTGKPATALSLDVDDKLLPGRTFRQHVPLITGEDVINFHPDGMAGLPISGEALLALQALPLGCAKVGGRLLAVHASDADVTRLFAKQFLQENRKAILNARVAGETKIPEPAVRVATLLIKYLLAVEEERQDREQLAHPVSITAYHFTNSGQGADLQTYHLPLEVHDFVSTAMTADYRADWNRIRERGWQISTRKSKAQAEFVPTYNVLYEDLLRLPADAARFVRLYLLRRPIASKRRGDPRVTYSIQGEASLVSWRLTDLFLRKVVCMETSRIAEIKALGDGLAQHIHADNDKRLFNSLLTAQYYSQLRAALLRANATRLRRGQTPLLRLEPYIAVFEDGEDLQRTDWRLARDLVLIRVIEQLYDLGWLQSNIEELSEYEETANATEKS